MLIHEKWHHATFHVIPNRKLHTVSFQMAYNVAQCTVGTLNSSNNAFFGVWSLDYPGDFATNVKQINSQLDLI